MKIINLKPGALGGIQPQLAPASSTKHHYKIERLGRKLRLLAGDAIAATVDMTSPGAKLSMVNTIGGLNLSVSERADLIKQVNASL